MPLRIALLLVLVGGGVIGVRYWEAWRLSLSAPRGGRPMFHEWSNTDWGYGWVLNVDDQLSDGWGSISYYDRPLNMMLVIMNRKLAVNGRDLVEFHADYVLVSSGASTMRIAAKEDTLEIVRTEEGLRQQLCLSRSAARNIIAENVARYDGLLLHRIARSYTGEDAEALLRRVEAWETTTPAAPASAP